MTKNYVKCIISFVSHDSVAQLDRAFDYESKGRRFESCRGRQFFSDKHSSIAQQVEQSAVNRSVVGSSPTRGAKKWPVGQAVKTPPFHGGYRGSNPLRVTIFNNPGRLAQLGERLPYKQDVGGSIPSSPTM